MSRADYEQLIACKFATATTSTVATSFALSAGSSYGKSWIFDFWASKCFCVNSKEFFNLNKYNASQHISLALWECLSYYRIRKYFFDIWIMYSKVLHTPNFPKNLLSISQFTKELNCCAFFTLNLVFFITHWREKIGGGHEDELYHLDTSIGITSSTESESKWFQWHYDIPLWINFISHVLRFCHKFSSNVMFVD